MINFRYLVALNSEKYVLPGYDQASSNKALALENSLIYFYLVHALAGLLFFFINLDLFYAYVTEDSYLEYLTALLLLALSFFCLYRGMLLKGHLPYIFFCAAAVLFFLGFGEEISWGQRLFGFETPENLKNINAQKEFNFHNIIVSGVKLNKLIFGKILYSSIFIYFLGFPILYRTKHWFRNLADKFKFPIPATRQSGLYFLYFFMILFVQDGEKWELQEFTIADYLFLVFCIR